MNVPQGWQSRNCRFGCFCSLVSARSLGWLHFFLFVMVIANLIANLGGLIEFVCI